MKYSLRSLMIVAILGPPLLAGGWFVTKSLWSEEPRASNLDAVRRIQWDEDMSDMIILEPALAPPEPLAP